MGRTVVERYVDLSLRMDAHIEGFVDAYVGPPEVKERIASEEPRDPRSLRDDAFKLLDEVLEAGLERDRVRWLSGQLRGIACAAERLAGEDIAWSDEVERCFGIRPRHVEEDVLRTSHRALDDVLPGAGDLRARYNAWIDSLVVPREHLLRTIDSLSSELRRRTSAIVDLPPSEEVGFETVEGEPWEAFNNYEGGLTSRVEVNADLPISLLALWDLVAHEAYPGHHTERACKEHLLYRYGSRHEMSVMIVAAPEAMIAEGIATNALEEALGDDGFGILADLAGDLGLSVDATTAEVVHREGWALFAAGANAAKMLHEDGATLAEVQSYLEEWALYSSERAAKTAAFLLDPGSRAYVTAYTDGRRLCRDFIARSPDGFRRLLTEQLTVADLVPDAEGVGAG
jgi:hypothetical protein